ncbi:aminopeptidase [Erysipelotrichaceae bacterium RD49]|nr:aminopeptidase [Erysipelotrichaceae bacterium RD49]
MNKPNVWLAASPEQKQEIMTVADNYMSFVSLAKTERRFVKSAIQLAEGFGYKNINDYVENNLPLKPQDKVYYNMMDKAVVLFHVGSAPVSQGMNILGAHIDSPRLDVKPHPIYEKDGICLLDTHYYGGIKKYQWVTVPLALYGVVFLKDGTHIDVAIGDHDEDEVFIVTDLLVHLSHERMTKPADKVIEGEQLNALFGSIPAAGVEKDPVKANILALLKDHYGIEEEDFLSAELELVPLGKARTCGLDRSMVVAYGQDDKVCAYTCLLAQLETSDETIERTSACLLVDKEEVGSMGATGMQSRFFENQVAELMNCLGQYNELNVRRALSNSYMLSCDVAAANDPNYSEASSPNHNMADFGCGVSIMKYVGSRGKHGSNDASAEFLAKLRQILDDDKIVWQMGELGKVDQGGGGTIAYILANYGMQVVDCGVPLMDMHAPYEVSSKADIYSALQVNKCFLKNMK